MRGGARADPGHTDARRAHLPSRVRGAWLQRSAYQRLSLDPLSGDALAELLRDLLGTDPSVTGLADRLCERTGGNPFFIEEVVQALIETGSLEGPTGAYRLVRSVAELAIPPTVQAVLAARIDRLPEREKEVLQTAAVIGRELPEPCYGRSPSWRRASSPPPCSRSSRASSCTKRCSTRRSSTPSSTR